LWGNPDKPYHFNYYYEVINGKTKSNGKLLGIATKLLKENPENQKIYIDDYKAKEYFN